MYKITVGNYKSVKEITKALKTKDIYVSSWAKDIMSQKDFILETELREIKIVIKTVRELCGDEATTEQIFNKAKEQGLELCPSETMAQIAIQQPEIIKDCLVCGMKQITDSSGGPSVFSLDSYGDQLELYGSYARPALRWFSVSKFVFRFRKSLKTLNPLSFDSLELGLLEKIKNLKKQDCELKPFNVTAEYGLGELRGYNQALEDVNKIIGKE